MHIFQGLERGCRLLLGCWWVMMDPCRKKRGVRRQVCDMAMNAYMLFRRTGDIYIMLRRLQKFF